MGDVDKVWARLGEYPVLVHSLMRLSPTADATVLVVHPSRVDRARDEVLPAFPTVSIVAGGGERQESVLRGLASLPPVDVVAIHDAARPFASATLLEAGARLLATADGAVPAELIRDTVKEIAEGGIIRRTLDRGPLRAAQTPQIFSMSRLWHAHRVAADRGDLYTDDASVMEASGGTVVCFPGSPGNFKITTPHDLYLAELLARNDTRV